MHDRIAKNPGAFDGPGVLFGYPLVSARHRPLGEAGRLLDDDRFGMPIRHHGLSRSL